MPDEHPAFLGADRDHPEQQPLQHQVRLLGEDLPVLERARLGFVGVADRVLRLSGLRRDQLPLTAGGEPGPAHAAQPGVLQRGGDPPGVQFPGQHRTQHPVAFLARRVGIVRPRRLCWPGGRRLGPAGPRPVLARGGAPPEPPACSFVTGPWPCWPAVGPCRADHRAQVCLWAGRALVDRDRGCHVAPADAGHLGDLHVGVAAVPVPQFRDPPVRALQPAGQVVAGVQLHLHRRPGAEVRVERDQPLDLVQRAADVTGQRYQFLARQPADPFLDRLQRRDQAGAGELARPRLDTRHPLLGPGHHRSPAGGAASAAADPPGAASPGPAPLAALPRSGRRRT